MNGALFFATRYGSTAQYAAWIADETGLPSIDVSQADSDPSSYDFLVIGAPVFYHRLLFNAWLARHRSTLLTRPVLLFSVSGARGGDKLDAWLASSLPVGLFDHVQHVALGGRQDPRDLTRFDRWMLVIGSWFNRDRSAAREEYHGFDFMDRTGIAPIVEFARRYEDEAISTQASAPATRGRALPA